MRLFRTLPALAGLFFGARASASRLDVRAPIDVCASLHTQLVVPNVMGILTAVGVIDVCLCVSAIPLFIHTNVVGIMAATIAGDATVTQILTQLIINAAPTNCHYPDHSVPACVNGNPCGFQCTNGFTPSPPISPQQCKCEAPKEVCNGVCQAKGACPSQQPQITRRWLGSGSCVEKGRGWAVCGVYGGGPRAWECVNTERDLESCGGCVVPLNAYSPKGKDCTAIPGVADVSCLGGGCAVRRCLNGLVPALDGSSCVRSALEHSHQYSQSENDVEVYDDAEIYGLEHVPLERL